MPSYDLIQIVPLESSTDYIQQVLNSSAPQETIDCVISYLPLRYGIKFHQDPNWYEIHSAWKWLATQGTNKSPMTTRPWISIEKMQEFAFPECISDYNSSRLTAEIEACLRNERRPLASSENNSADFPNQLDQERVAQSITGLLLNVGGAFIQGGVEYSEFSVRNPGMSDIAVSITGDELSGFLLGAVIFAIPGAVGFFERIEHQINNPEVLPIIPEAPQEGCWPYFKRIAFNFFSHTYNNFQRDAAMLGEEWERLQLPNRHIQ